MIMTEQGKNLDLLMNVPLKVTAELGTCKMLVRDILKLGQGSVVELDRIDDVYELRRRFVAEGVWVRPFGSIVYLTPAFTIA